MSVFLNLGAVFEGEAMSHENILKLLEDFASAWNAHDEDALMACMGVEPVYHAAAGSRDDSMGKTFVGQTEVRKAFAAIWQTFPDARWSNPVHFVSGNRGTSEWLFTGTDKQGQSVTVNGVDTFLIENGKIAVKNTYRKQLSD